MNFSRFPPGFRKRVATRMSGKRVGKGGVVFVVRGRGICGTGERDLWCGGKLWCGAICGVGKRIEKECKIRASRLVRTLLWILGPVKVVKVAFPLTW